CDRHRRLRQSELQSGAREAAKARDAEEELQLLRLALSALRKCGRQPRLVAVDQLAHEVVGGTGAATLNVCEEVVVHLLHRRSDGVEECFKRSFVQLDLGCLLVLREERLGPVTATCRHGCAFGWGRPGPTLRPELAKPTGGRTIASRGRSEGRAFCSP